MAQERHCLRKSCCVGLSFLCQPILSKNLEATQGLGSLLQLRETKRIIVVISIKQPLPTSPANANWEASLARLKAGKKQTKLFVAENGQFGTPFWTPQIPRKVYVDPFLRSFPGNEAHKPFWRGPKDVVKFGGHQTVSSVKAQLVLEKTWNFTPRFHSVPDTSLTSLSCK